MLQELAWDLERDRPVPGTPWKRPAVVMHVIALAEEAEPETAAVSFARAVAEEMADAQVKEWAEESSH